MTTEESGEVAPPKKARRRAAPPPPTDLNEDLAANPSNLQPHQLAHQAASGAAAAVVSTLLSNLQPEFKKLETKDDANHRRKQEFLSFVVKELSPFCLAGLFILAAGVYCFFELLNPKASPDAQQRAWTAFTMLLSGVLGFVFGKTAGK
jgi:hypothetical protein